MDPEKAGTDPDNDPDSNDPDRTDPDRTDPDSIVKPGQDEQPQLGDANAGGQPVDAAEQDPTPTQT